LFHKSHCVAVGQVQINLKPLGQRSPISQVVVRLKKATAGLEGLTVGMQTRQDIQVGGRSSASQYQYTLQDPDSAELDKWAALMAKTLASLRELQEELSH
jgi:multidrug efflux pump